MTSPELQWFFETIDGIVDGTSLAWGSVSDGVDTDAGDVPVRRVDRDESSLYDEPGIQSRQEDLQQSNLIGASLVERPTSPAGTSEYRAEAVVSVRIEALSRSKFGHIDATGVDAVPFGDLHGPVRQALRDAMEYPDVSREGTSYQSAILENETNRSSEHRDFYDYRFDVRFRGYET